MKSYLTLLEDVLENGLEREDRTGTGTLSAFGRQCRYNLQEGFPAVTTKKLYFKGVVGELLWFLSGDTNTKFLTDNNIHIWDAWADSNGDLGPVYGAQWRSWECPRDERPRRGWFDQIQTVANTIKNNPDSRRHIVSAWNVADLEEMALVPCHLLFQFYVREGRFLDCQLYQRSADLFLGVPFNVASYALLTSMMAQAVGLEPGEFVHTIGDAHIYKNHIPQVRKQLARVPKKLPKLWLNPKRNMIPSLFEYDFDDIRLEGYEHHPSIKAKVAV